MVHEVLPLTGYRQVRRMMGKGEVLREGLPVSGSRQVRRMMGAMVGVARGQMTAQQLQHYLDHPNLNNPGGIQALTGQGLTLKEVHYPQHGQLLIRPLCVC